MSTIATHGRKEPPFVAMRLRDRTGSEAGHIGAHSLARALGCCVQGWEVFGYPRDRKILSPARMALSLSRPGADPVLCRAADERMCGEPTLSRRHRGRRREARLDEQHEWRNGDVFIWWVDEGKVRGDSAWPGWTSISMSLRGLTWWSVRTRRRRQAPQSLVERPRRQVHDAVEVRAAGDLTTLP
jgi:hypothetical protein